MEFGKRKSSKSASLCLIEGVVLPRITSLYHTVCSQLVTSVIDVQDDYLPENIAFAIRDFWNFGVRYCFQEQECCYFLAATKQLYEWFSPPVHPSAHHTFFTMFPSSFLYNIWGCMCSTGPFQYRWLKGYIYSSCYYHHQIGSIHISHCYHIFLWLCAWDVCYIIFCHLLHIRSGKPGICFHYYCAVYDQCK